MIARPKPTLKGEALPNDWIVAPYFGSTRLLRNGDMIVFTVDRAVHEDDALGYRDALVTRSKQGRAG